MPLSKEKIEAVVKKNEAYWSPGKVAVIDLQQFSICVSESESGEAAKRASDQYALKAKEDPTLASYIVPRARFPTDASGYLGLLNSRRIGVAGKMPAAECATLAYEAVAECLLDEEIRKNYDILQVGSMHDDKKGKYLHNICIIVPKGEGEKLKLLGKEPLKDGQLPEGALIVDPWARAMGQTAEKSLFCSPSEYAYTGLYPLIINYNSAELEPEELDKVVDVFREKVCTKDFFAKYSEALGLNKDNEYLDVKVDRFSRQLSEKIAESIGLEPSESIASITVNRQNQTLNIEIRKEGQEKTRIIDSEEYSVLVIANMDKPKEEENVGDQVLDGNLQDFAELLYENLADTLSGWVSSISAQICSALKGNPHL